ncbi:MAG: AAA family ATPase [Gammaproteobacteria bacterium]|nr:AAA family ATPase [Gammaproteobacteria bacterium]
MDLEDQARLIAALQREPGRFPHPVQPVQLLETHISRVLLTGAYAYKFKKPVNLGFLDFSTLEQRRFYCHEELRLNRRLAPALYESVVSITGTPDDPQFDGAGPVIDYAVCMHQFPDGARLDEVSDRGELTAAHIDQIVATLAAFHRHAPAAGTDSLHGTPAGIGDRVRQNFEQIEAHCEDDTIHAQLQPLRVWSEAQLRALHDDMELRRREGWIRECHGDLHLANMALIDDGVVIFDALEFSDDLRWIDPLSEVAFLYMDLEHRGHSALARRFLNGYLEAANDYQGLGLFQYYLAYRAMVRAKVAAIEAYQHHKEPERARMAMDTLRGYLDLATRYSAPREPAPLIVLHGYSGSGKSWLSRRLIESLGAIRLRSDVERKRLLGLSPEDCTDSGIATGAYAPEITEKTYQRLLALAYPILDARFPAIVDATFLLRNQRAPFQRLAQIAGVPFVILDMHAPDALLRERIGQRTRTERDASEATLAVLEHQQKIAEPLTSAEQTSAVGVDSSRTPDLDTLGRSLLARSR